MHSCCELWPGLHVALNVCLDPIRGRHDEAAATVTLGTTKDLACDQCHTKAFLTPAGRIPGIHDADGRFGLAVRARPCIRFERIGVIVYEVILLVRRGTRLGKNINECPPAVREVNGPGGQASNRIGQLHLGMEAARIGFSDGVGEVEEDVSGKVPGFFLASLAEKIPDQGKELHGERRGPYQYIPFAEDLDGPVRRVGPAPGEVAGDDLFGLGKDRLDFFRDSYCLQSHDRSPYPQSASACSRAASAGDDG